jgi:transposase InsO family protein
MEVEGGTSCKGLIGCPVCTEGKLQRTEFKKRIYEGVPKKPLSRIHLDLMGPMDVQSQHRKRYALVMTDDCTNFVWVYELGQKSEAAGKIKTWLKEVERQFPQWKVQVFRSDRGGEFFSNAFRAWLTAEGILHDLACSHTPQQNGKASR